MSLLHTIVAPTSLSPSAITIIRITGPSALSSLSLLHPPTLPRPRTAYYRSLLSPSPSKEVVDRILAFHLPPTKNSLSPYDTVEFHLHGAVPIVRKALSLLSDLEGFRPAHRGEFTQLSFRTNRLPGGMLGLEAFAALMGASTERERRVVQRWNEKSGNKDAWESVKREIIKARAGVEAVIEFGETDGGDNEGIGEGEGSGAWEDARTTVQRLLKLLKKQLEKTSRTQLLTEGTRIAIFGPPNAGKSSLTNWLSKNTVSIVTPFEGTTRDVIETPIDYKGFKVLLSDTAGLRFLDMEDQSSGNFAEAQKEIERIGIEKAIDAVKRATLPLLLLSIPDTFSSTADQPPALNKSISQLLRSFSPTSPLLVLLNKSDLLPSSSPSLSSISVSLKSHLSSAYGLTKARVFVGSVKTGDLGEVETGLEEALENCTLSDNERVEGEEEGWIMNLRQASNTRACVENLEDFLKCDLKDIVFAAEELRLATTEIERLIGGGVDVEDVLGEIFGNFCIGK
ncbi:P-loop containing nucleoside triphosphate hydrolase protein [Atractiella rhizophila]|nr:P-loop containing nucleoside triphosphate hydrolase protein [Atractiella rhizophila]